MKSKKKMLLALGAMSIAAIGAGSVSTFAWFQATNTINVANQNIIGTATTANPTKSVTTTLPLDITVERRKLDNSGNSGYTANLEQATFKESGALKHGYYDEAGKQIEQDAKLSANDDWALYKVLIKSPAAGATIGGVSYDHAEVAQLLDAKDKTFSLTVDAKTSTYTEVGGSGTKAAEDTDYWSLSGGVYTKETVVPGDTVVSGFYTRAQVDSRVRLWKHSTEGTAPTLTQLTAAGGTSVSLASSHEIVAATLDGAGYVFYFAFYVEGHGTNDSTAESITAGFTVTVE